MLQFKKILLLVLVSFRLNAAEEEKKPVGSVSARLSLKEAIAGAFTKNPNLQGLREKAKQADAAGWLGISAALPVVNAQFQMNRQKEATNSSRSLFNGDSYNFYSGSFELNQSLLKRGFFSAIFASKKEKNLSDLELEIATRDLSFDLARSYYKVLLSKKNIGNLQESEKLEKQSLEVAQHRWKIGRSQKLDVLQVKAQIAVFAPRIQKAMDDLKATMAELANRMGESNLDSVDLEGELKLPSLKKLKSKIKNIEPHIPELSRAVLKERQFDEIEDVSLGKHWPSLSAVGNIGRQGYKMGTFTDSRATHWEVGLLLEIPIFSGGSYFFDRMTLSAQKQQLKAEEIAIRNQFSLNQIQADQNLESAEAMIESSKEAFNLSGQAVQEARRNFKTNTIDTLQLVTTERNFLDAAIAYDQAQYDYIDALAKYFTAFGYPADLFIEELSSSS